MDVAPRGMGWVEVITGPMFSGKTEELLRRLRRAVIARQKVQVFKPLLDDRYGVQQVASHSGFSMEAHALAHAREILDHVRPDTTVVAIDEAQFFDQDLVSVVETLAQQGLRVLLSGLDLDFRGEPFGPMPARLALADQVDKLHAICMVCGGPATRTQRLINGQPARYDDPVVLVGADDFYEPRCRFHHVVLPPAGADQQEVSS